MSLAKLLTGYLLGVAHASSAFGCWLLRDSELLPIAAVPLVCLSIVIWLYVHEEKP